MLESLTRWFSSNLISDGDRSPLVIWVESSLCVGDEEVFNKEMKWTNEHYQEEKIKLLELRFECF